jgi:hypothetical protein
MADELAKRKKIVENLWMDERAGAFLLKLSLVLFSFHLEI